MNGPTNRDAREERSVKRHQTVPKIDNRKEVEMLGVGKETTTENCASGIRATGGAFAGGVDSQSHRL